MRLVTMNTNSSPRRPRAGFTLTEVIVAIAILVGVMLAASKIFNTTSQVSRVGEATNNVMQDIAAGERQLRADFSSLSRDGFFAIRCVAVPNSIYANTLLDPNRPPDAMIRCDQLVFFTTESSGSAAYTHVEGNNWIGGLHRGRGLSNRIYYGHGFSLGTQGAPFDSPNVFDSAQPILPWSANSFRLRPVDMSGLDSMWTEGGQILRRLPVPQANRWSFVRQPLMLANDGRDNDASDYPNLYLDEVRTGRSIFYDDPVLGITPEALAGRVDVVETDFGDIRKRLLWQDPSDDTSPARPWRGTLGGTVDAYSLIRDEALYYPRAERYAPSMHRLDQVLTNSLLFASCSDVRIEWTWDEGVGAVTDANGSVLNAPGSDEVYGTGDDFRLTGVNYQTSEPPGPRWFGLPDEAYSRDDQRNGVFPYSYIDPAGKATTIDQTNIEEWDLDDDIKTYTAIFGYNQNSPLDNAGNPQSNLAFTPWPTAIRVTLTLHDPRNVFETGREVQFILEIPKRHVDY